MNHVFKRQLSRETSEEVNRQIKMMDNDMNEIGDSSLKDFNGFEESLIELNTIGDGPEFILEEIVEHEAPNLVPIENSPDIPSSSTSSHCQSEDQETDADYVPFKARAGAKRKLSKPGRRAKRVKGHPKNEVEYVPKYATEQSKPGPKPKKTDAELTPDELERRNTRRARNREAANRQRDRRNAQVSELESQVIDLTEEKTKLKEELEDVKKQLSVSQSQPNRVQYVMVQCVPQNIQFVNRGVVQTQATMKPSRPDNLKLKIPPRATKNVEKTLKSTVSTTNNSSGQVNNLPSPYTIASNLVNTSPTAFLMSPSMVFAPFQYPPTTAPESSIGFAQTVEKL